MKGDVQLLHEVATLCRAIRSLAYDLERDPQEFADAMTAITELAVGAHDRIDFTLRKLDGEVGIGFLDGVRAELDDALQAARRPPDMTAAARARGSRKELKDSTTPTVYPATPPPGSS